jgi:hypothetical protein
MKKRERKKTKKMKISPLSSRGRRVRLNLNPGSECAHSRPGAGATNTRNIWSKAGGRSPQTFPLQPKKGRGGSEEGLAPPRVFRAERSSQTRSVAGMV